MAQSKRIPQVEPNQADGTIASPAAPPDGGLTAWLQVLCMHFVFFNSWGVSNGFSVFEQLYTETLSQDASTISWIGSVQVSLLFFMGVIAGRATDAGYFRIVYSTGVLLQVFGFFMLSLCDKYWQIFLAQAVCMGLGNGLTFSPGLSVMSSYFARHRAVAVGIAAAGAATGGMVYPVIINQMIYEQHVGFGWTVRAAGLVMLVTQVPGLFLFKPRFKAHSTGPLVDWTAFKEKSFVFFALSMFFNFWGLYFAFFYLGNFARDQIQVQSTQDYVLILNGVGVVGRIIPSLVGDQITGKLNILIPFSFAVAIVIYAWIAVKDEGGLYAFTVVYGLVGGAAQSLFPAAATTMTPDVRKTGTRLGMILSFVGFATLTGPAIDGALVQNMNGSYTGAQAFAGSCIILGAIAGAASRVAKTGWHWRVKVSRRTEWSSSACLVPSPTTLTIRRTLRLSAIRLNSSDSPTGNSNGAPTKPKFGSRWAPKVTGSTPTGLSAAEQAMRDKIVANSRPPPPPPSKQQRGKPSQNDQNTRSPRGRFGYQRDRPSRYSFQGQNSSEEKNPFDSHGPAQQRPNWQKLGSQHTRQNFEKFSHIEPRRVYEKHPSRREENPFLTPGPPSKIQPEQKKPVSYQINAAGDWNCPTCAAEVLSYKEQCPHCKTERPEEVRPEEPTNDSKLRNLGRSVLSEMDQDWEADTDRDQHHTKETESASGDARKEPKKDPSSWDLSVLDNLESFEMADPEPVEPVKQTKNRVDRKGRESNFEDDGFDEAARERSRQHRKAQQKEKAARKAAKKAEPAPLYLPEFISVGNLADVIGVKPAQFVARMEEMGFEEITYKDILDAETAGLVAAEYNFEAIFDIGENDLKAAPEPEDPSSLPSRPPVVTIMGHVDHGKTTILDWLRKSSVAATEHGGITQHIGAFSVNMPAGKAITFLDTPGHSAFLEMRRRGADVTDIVVLVVAADDSVKPQTIEAIKHANSAKVPVIVAISKIDKEGKNPDKVKADLSAQGVHVEDYGGDVQAIGVSGKTGEGMVELEEAIMALSEMLDHRADTACNVEGWVIEASTKSYGRVASALIRRGTLRPGDIIVAGTAWARVRTLRNEAGVTIHEATPGMPVEIDGWREQPGAGTEILQAPDEQKAKEVVEYRLERTDTEKMGIDMVAINEARREITETRRREKEDEDETRRRLESESTGPKPVNFILKADVDGSAEAVMNSVSAIGNNEVFANIIRSGVGPVSEFDIEHAATAGGRIISFNQPIDPNMMRMAEAERVEIMDHNIIYKLTDEVKSILSDLLPPSVTIRVTGEAEIREVFSITIKGREKMLIAGSRVRNGMINKARKVKVLRGEEVVYDGAITSLKNVKKDVTEMRKDTECGIGFEGWTDFAVGDRIQCYDEIFEKRYL
ncbi:hypothetical protein MYU51_015519 [Penicillium brevicompactum]